MNCSMLTVMPSTLIRVSKVCRDCIGKHGTLPELWERFVGHVHAPNPSGLREKVLPALFCFTDVVKFV